MASHVRSSKQPCEGGPFITYILQPEDPRHREISYVDRGHTVEMPAVDPNPRGSQVQGYSHEGHCLWTDETRISKATAASAVSSWEYPPGSGGVYPLSHTGGMS